MLKSFLSYDKFKNIDAHLFLIKWLKFDLWSHRLLEKCR
jgi:hypothetical protein